MSINYAPSITPNVQDPTAPNAQDVCSGYKASNVVETTNSLTADLTLLGEGCNVYGNDINDLVLSVEYQTKERLSVRITPKYLAPANHSQYILSPRLDPPPAQAQAKTQAIYLLHGPTTRVSNSASRAPALEKSSSTLTATKSCSKTSSSN
jgi:alpha-glucosidase